jgi:hypothetical protein
LPEYDCFDKIKLIGNFIAIFLKLQSILLRIRLFFKGKHIFVYGNYWISIIWFYPTISSFKMIFTSASIY